MTAYNHSTVTSRMTPWQRQTAMQTLRVKTCGLAWVRTRKPLTAKQECKGCIMESCPAIPACHYKEQTFSPVRKKAVLK